MLSSAIARRSREWSRRPLAPRRRRELIIRSASGRSQIPHCGRGWTLAKLIMCVRSVQRLVYMVGPELAKWPSWRTNIVSKQLCKILPKSLHTKHGSRTIAYQAISSARRTVLQAFEYRSLVSLQFLWIYQGGPTVCNIFHHSIHSTTYHLLITDEAHTGWNIASRLQFDSSKLAWSILLSCLPVEHSALELLCSIAFVQSSPHAYMCFEHSGVVRWLHLFCKC